MRALLLCIITGINSITILKGGVKSNSWSYWVSTICICAAVLTGVLLNYGNLMNLVFKHERRKTYVMNGGIVNELSQHNKR